MGPRDLRASRRGDRRGMVRGETVVPRFDRLSLWDAVEIEFELADSLEGNERLDVPGNPIDHVAKSVVDLRPRIMLRVEKVTVQPAVAHRIEQAVNLFVSALLECAENRLVTEPESPIGQGEGKHRSSWAVITRQDGYRSTQSSGFYGEFERIDLPARLDHAIGALVIGQMEYFRFDIVFGM